MARKCPIIVDDNSRTHNVVCELSTMAVPPSNFQFVLSVTYETVESLRDVARAFQTRFFIFNHSNLHSSSENNKMWILTLDCGELCPYLKKTWV